MSNKREQTELEKWLQDQMEVTRLLVLLEDHDGFFRQVLMSRDQFIKMSDIIVQDPWVSKDDQKEQATFKLRLDLPIPAEVFGDMESFEDDNEDTRSSLKKTL